MVNWRKLGKVNQFFRRAEFKSAVKDQIAFKFPIQVKVNKRGKYSAMFGLEAAECFPKYVFLKTS